MGGWIHNPDGRFGMQAEAVAMVNDTPAGLACYLFSQDLALAWRMAEVLSGTLNPENVMWRTPFSGSRLSLGAGGRYFYLQKRIYVLVLESQLPHKIVNLLLTITN